jgi:hypothetical protein
LVKRTKVLFESPFNEAEKGESKGTSINAKKGSSKETAGFF